MHKLTVIALLLGCILFCSGSAPALRQHPDKPIVSFTFDDGVTNDICGVPFFEWNAMILQSLDEAGIKAVFFVTGSNKTDEKGRYLLQSWDQKGHSIANHSFTHPSFAGDKKTIQNFETELLKTDSIIAAYNHYKRLFRFPYLKEGNTREKVDGMREVLHKYGYKNGYVTIDASDWYVDSRLRKQLQERGMATVNVEKFRDFYLDHILERARFYEDLSYQMNGRHIRHTLLLHHNLTSALFLDDLIKRFKAEGWDVTDAEKAFQDDIFNASPQVLPAGESLIWSLAKASGKYEKVLRYPAEDSQYEETRMDALGL